jgi:hypothetical protein
MGEEPIGELQGVFREISVMVVAEGNRVIERPAGAGVTSTYNMGAV